jgi:hypothetical protein
MLHSRTKNLIALTSLASSLLMPSLGQSQPVNTERFCSMTQTDDCILIDANGIWWDSEPSRAPIYKKRQSLTIINTPSARVVQLGDDFYCDNMRDAVRKGYMKCTSLGWKLTSHN